MSQNKVVNKLLERVEKLKPLIESKSKEMEVIRRVPVEIYNALFDAGLFAMLAPKKYGGYELEFTECLQVWEAVALIDASVAWNLVIGQGSAQYVAWLDEKGAAEVMANGPITVAGSLMPPSKSVRVDGGWLVSGQGTFGSGCHNAQYMAAGAFEMEGDKQKINPTTGRPVVRGFLLDRKDVTILDTWHVYGAKGTGSSDYSFKDVFVPERRSGLFGRIDEMKTASGFEGPLYRMVPMTAIVGEALVSVALASRSIEDAISLCKDKVPTFNYTPVKDQQLMQYLLGRAKSRVNAARDTLFAAASGGYDEVTSTGKALSDSAKIRLQLASCFAVEVSAEAIRNINDLVGSTGIRLEAPFERYFRDSHVLLQHASKSIARYASAGRMMFGLDPNWYNLSF